MVEYIKDFVDDVIQSVKTTYGGGANDGPSTAYLRDVKAGLAALVQELDRLDPRDFEPLFRSDFIRTKSNLTYFATFGCNGPAVAAEALGFIKSILCHYRGPGSGGITRSFSFVLNTELRTIIERDYADLRLRLFPAGAWKPTVVMAGSILEAILFDRLEDRNWNGKAITSNKVPTDRQGPLPLEKWKLQNLIDVAVNIKLLPLDPANTIHKVLRDFRNFIHPKKELRAAHPCTEAEAMLAVGALDSVCNYFETHP